MLEAAIGTSGVGDGFGRLDPAHEHGRPDPPDKQQSRGQGPPVRPASIRPTCFRRQADAVFIFTPPCHLHAIASETPPFRHGQPRTLLTFDLGARRIGARQHEW